MPPPLPWRPPGNKDAAAVFDSGEGIYFACEGCHQQYRYDDGPSTMR